MADEGSKQDFEQYLKRYEVVVEHLSDFMSEFEKESDRAAVVVGAAKVDSLLHQLLTRALVPCVSSRDELLDSEFALGSFSARIHACYRLGLIDSELARALHIVRRIRNEFAHEPSSVSLSSGSQRDRIRELIAPLRGSKSVQRMRAGVVNQGPLGDSKDFRAALAWICVVLSYALENVDTVKVSIMCGLTRPQQFVVTVRPNVPFTSDKENVK